MFLGSVAAAVTAAAAVWAAAARRAAPSPTTPPAGTQLASTPPASELDEARAEETYAHFRAGAELLAGGHPAQACIRLEKARRLAPDRNSVREALGRAYFAVGRLAEAEEEFRSVIARAPSDDYAHYCLSRTLHRLGRPTEAVAHLRLARAMRPGDPRYAPAPR